MLSSGPLCFVISSVSWHPFVFVFICAFQCAAPPRCTRWHPPLLLQQITALQITLLPSGKLTYLWKITIFNGKTPYKWTIIHCYVSLPECIACRNADHKLRIELTMATTRAPNERPDRSHRQGSPHRRREPLCARKHRVFVRFHPHRRHRDEAIPLRSPITALQITSSLYWCGVVMWWCSDVVMW